MKTNFLIYSYFIEQEQIHGVLLRRKKKKQFMLSWKSFEGLFWGEAHLILLLTRLIITLKFLSMRIHFRLKVNRDLEAHFRLAKSHLVLLWIWERQFYVEIGHALRSRMNANMYKMNEMKRFSGKSEGQVRKYEEPSTAPLFLSFFPSMWTFPTG